MHIGTHTMHNRLKQVSCKKIDLGGGVQGNIPGNAPKSLQINIEKSTDVPVLEKFKTFHLINVFGQP